MAEIFPLVSVVMPVYNAEAFLHNSIEDILHQTFSDFELICIDDESTDHSLEILQEYAGIDNRVHYLQQQHQNAGMARTLGISHAAGKYLLFLDADDRFDSDLIDTVVRRAEETDADIVLFPVRVLDVQTGKMTGAYGLYKSFIPGELFSASECPNTLYRLTGAAPWNKLFRRDFILEKKITFPNIQNAEDIPFVYTALAIADSITTVDKVLLTYRKNNPNSQENSSNRKLYCFYDALLELKQRLLQFGVYELINPSFLTYAGMTCIYNLNQTQSVYRFEQLYYFIKNTVIPEFGVFECPNDTWEESIQKKLYVLLRQSIFDYASEYQQECPGIRDHYLIKKINAPQAEEYTARTEALLESVYQSHSYRLGNRIIHPIHKIRQFLKGIIGK